MTKPELKPLYMFDRFDRVFEDWMKMIPWTRPMFFTETWLPEDFIRVDEFRENGTYVVRAELPDVDPDKDVDITVINGLLRIEAERHATTTEHEPGYFRKELRQGTFHRTLRLPEGAVPSDIKATYMNGILEVRIPVSVPTPPDAVKVPVTPA
jgi:HSP20 family protein